MSIFSNRSSFYSRRCLAPGFTLMELMVVIGIMFLITSIILFNQTRFNSAILLRNLAYEVGFSVHEAQLYGVAVKGTETSSFNAPYGIVLDNTDGTLLNAANSSYPLFIDMNADKQDDSGDAVADTFQIQNGFFIKDFCVSAGGAPECASTGSIKWLAITFVRPNPNAIITTDKDTSGTKYSYATITVGSSNGTTRTVTVWNTGFIDVPTAASVS